LRVAAAARPAAAWNPIAGFSDETGGLVWSALGDAAMLPEPYGGGWLSNRARAVEVSGPVEVPRDALVPEPSTGALRAAAPGMVAQQRVTYRVALSKFHDETKMTVADLVYPYVFARRWSAPPRRGVALPGAGPEARRRPRRDRRGLRAPGVRARAAPGARDGRAGPSAVGRAPALPAPARPLARDERALPASEVVGRLRG